MVEPHEAFLIVSELKSHHPIAEQTLFGRGCCGRLDGDSEHNEPVVRDDCSIPDEYEVA
tara:strand:+ start:988 stop:1164 length:177 start_codon:yes stop_codon:yes gene_type:complete